MCITAVFIFGVTCWSRSAVVQCFCVVCFMFFFFPYKLFSIIVFNTSWTRNRFLILSLYWLDCDSKGYSWTRSLYTIVWQQLFLFHVVKLPRLSPCLGFANSCPSCPLCLSHRKQSFNLDSLSWRQPVCLPLCCAQEHPAITFNCISLLADYFQRCVRRVKLPDARRLVWVVSLLRQCSGCSSE